MPASSKVPSFLLYAAISRSPWKTWICTDGWLSSAVVKISERLVAMVVFRSMRTPASLITCWNGALHRFWSHPGGGGGMIAVADGGEVLTACS
jgi:hypothetical protein